MIRFIDIDGTICDTIGIDYESAIPKRARIELINKWYDQGDMIVYYTSRGFKMVKDYKDLTIYQLDKWGCKYHELRMDKPLYDKLYDDRAFNSEILDVLKDHA